MGPKLPDRSSPISLLQCLMSAVPQIQRELLHGLRECEKVAGHRHGAFVRLAAGQCDFVIQVKESNKTIQASPRISISSIKEFKSRERDLPSYLMMTVLLRSPIPTASHCLRAIDAALLFSTLLCAARGSANSDFDPAAARGGGLPHDALMRMRELQFTNQCEEVNERL